MPEQKRPGKNVLPYNYAQEPCWKRNAQGTALCLL